MTKRLSAIFGLYLTAMLAFAAGNTSELGLCWFNYSIDGGTTAVFDIYRDSSNRNWIGTTSGLYRFNGYQAHTAMLDGQAFRAQVYAMVEHENKIYIGSNNGLFMLDPAENTIENIEGSFPREIRSLLKVGNTLWIGSLSGLFHYRLDSGTLSGPVDKTPHHAVYSLIESSDGIIYIGTYDGLGTYNPATGEYSTVELPRPDGAAAANTFVNVVVEDVASGLIYLGTEGALYSLDAASGTVARIKACDGNSVKSLALTDRGVVAGTDNGLVIIYDNSDSLLFRHDSRNPYSIASNVVWSLFADKSGNIWCGTEAGVSIIDMQSAVKVLSIADISGMSEGQKVHNILRDSHGLLWLGGSNGLLQIGDDGAMSSVWYMPGSSNKLSHNRVRDITESSAGDIWVATDGGLNVYDRNTKRFSNHRISDRSRHLNANWAYGVLEDTSDSTLWVAGYLGGVFCEKLSRFRSEGLLHIADTVLSAANSVLPNDLIGQMLQDGKGNKWVLHFRDSALTRIDAETKQISRVPVSRLAGHEPTMICADPLGGIWCGFYGGIVHIDASGVPCDTVVFFPFGIGDETVRAMAPVGKELWVATDPAVFAVDPAVMKARLLPLPSKSYSAIYYDRSRREVILGADDEIIIADPQRLIDEQNGNSITRVSIKEGSNIISIPTDGAAKNRVARLPNGSRNIELYIIDADFSPASYMRFCYRLDNDKQWQLLPDGTNRILLTALTPGKHLLHVAIAGAPDSARTLVLKVARPWYLTGTALALYALAILGIAFFAMREVRRRQRRNIEEVERKNVLATVENRLFFLANISHELKTPLSMIIGPLSKIRMGEAGDEVAQDVETAYRNALKLNSLIHQTVEINRMELRDENMLIYSRIDIVEFCRDMFDSYRRSVADRTFVFSSSATHIYARTDAVKLESLLSNLLSNAVKYTHEGSTIALAVSADDTDFEIAVSDDGVGILRAEQSLVFQRLYRSPRTATSHEGTGLGLYLVRQYAQLLGGSVTVESRVDEGSTFRLRLPVGESAEESFAGGEEVNTSYSDKRKRVLIVDDNRSIASFLSSILGKEYNCAVAANGKAGLTVAASFRPDLIIADEMMPVMSGLEMCRRIKDNPALALVPILLLTAKDTPDIQGESINSGVDAFMAKPFEAHVLTAKVAQLINSGEKMRAQMRRDELTAAEPTETESVAERQLAEVTAVIENNLSNPDLNVDFVCRTMGMSSKTLYRLIKKYVGVSPVDYIRQTRLRKAAMLLEQKKFSVSEVMYMVGFSSSSYFSKCFAAMFGCTPGQYPGTLHP